MCSRFVHVSLVYDSINVLRLTRNNRKTFTQRCKNKLLKLPWKRIYIHNHNNNNRAPKDLIRNWVVVRIAKSSLNVIPFLLFCLSLRLLTFIFGEVGKLRLRNFLCFLPPLLLSSSSSQTFFDPLFHRQSILVVVLVRHNKFCYV